MATLPCPTSLLASGATPDASFFQVSVLIRAHERVFVKTLARARSACARGLPVRCNLVQLGNVPRYASAKSALRSWLHLFFESGDYAVCPIEISITTGHTSGPRGGIA